MSPRKILTPCVLIALLLGLFVLPGCSVNVKDGGEESKNVDIKTPVVGVHVGKDADAGDTGIAVYPGAHKVEKKDSKSDEEQNANLSIATSAFGLKVVAVEFHSNDSPQKVMAFYKDKLKQYGSVLECHSQEHGGGVSFNSSDDKDSKETKQLKCETNDGPVTELKAGTQDNQHIVSIKTDGDGTRFALVHVKIRGEASI